MHLSNRKNKRRFFEKAMKFKFLDIRGVFIFMLSITGAAPAFAQDGLPTPMNEVKEINLHPELNINDDKVLIAEPVEQKASNAVSSSAKETASNQAKATKLKAGDTTATKSVGEKKEPDPLSFNFLYYLIQKVKFSDMMDE